MSFSLIEIDPVHRIYSGHFSSFPEDIAVHGVSCRRGGVSKSPWDSLDLGLHVGDDPADVAENRRRYLAALRLDASQLVTPEQVHGEAIQRVGRSDAGRGALSYADSIARTSRDCRSCSALLTARPSCCSTPLIGLSASRTAVGRAQCAASRRRPSCACSGSLARGQRMYSRLSAHRSARAATRSVLRSSASSKRPSQAMRRRSSRIQMRWAART